MAKGGREERWGGDTINNSSSKESARMSRNSSAALAAFPCSWRKNPGWQSHALSATSLSQQWVLQCAHYYNGIFSSTFAKREYSFQKPKINITDLAADNTISIYRKHTMQLLLFALKKKQGKYWTLSCFLPVYNFVGEMAYPHI